MTNPCPLPARPSGILHGWRGDTYQVTCRFRTYSTPGDKTSPLVAVDLTTYGSQFMAQLRWVDSSDAPIPLDFVVSDSQAVSGLLTMSLTPDQTASLTDSVYGFDVKATDPVPDPPTVRTLVAAQIKIDGNYTRA